MQMLLVEFEEMQQTQLTHPFANRVRLKSDDTKAYVDQTI